MGRYDNAKAAAKLRTATGGDDSRLFEGAPGVYVVLRNAAGIDTEPALRGTWSQPWEVTTIRVTKASGAETTRWFRRALQLYERTWLYVEAPHA